MNNDKICEYLHRLKSEISPALGCTEPAAAALTAAYAAEALGEPVLSIEMKVSEYIFKNGMNVGIPGTGMIGLDIAVALGAVSADPEKSLMVLTGMDEGQKKSAMRLVAEKRVRIGLAKTSEKVYIEAEVIGETHRAKAVISKTHTTLTLLERDGKVLHETEGMAETNQPICPEQEYTVTLNEIVDFVNSVPDSEITFLKEVIHINRQIAEEGLKNDYGLKVGKSILENGNLGLSVIDAGSYAVACTAAAADARMAGCDKPVMSTAGSGNQGLTASIPVAAIGWKLEKPTEKTLRALALSILVTIHTKHYIGRLSVLCGCSIAAAIGTCCGVIYLLDGTAEQMGYGINTMVADISGVVCDGAKPGCALKIATAVSSAIRAATMALNGVGADSHDGIVDFDAERTLANLGTLGNQGMVGTNATILNIMLEKQ